MRALPYRTLASLARPPSKFKYIRVCQWRPTERSSALPAGGPASDPARLSRGRGSRRARELSLARRLAPRVTTAVQAARWSSLPVAGARRLYDGAMFPPPASPTPTRLRRDQRASP
jgi:hypothetical protein